jgi:hypothetical protein
MPYHVDFDSVHRILRCRLEGCITDEELRQYYRLAEDHVAKTDPLGGILDMTAVTSFDVSPTTIRQLAKSRSAFTNPDHPRVLIASCASVFGLARMFEMEGQDKRPNLHVVRSEKEALAILGIHKANFAPIQIT